MNKYFISIVSVNLTILYNLYFNPLQVEWLKNEEPLRVDIPHKYEVLGNGTQLRVRNIGFADTGAYMCQAGSVGGVARDISSLVVQENPMHSKIWKITSSMSIRSVPIYW